MPIHASMWTGIQQLARASVADDRRLAAALQSLLLTAAALAVALMVAVPGEPLAAAHVHEPYALAIAAVVLVYAAVSLRLPWERMPAAAAHVAALLALPTVMGVAAWTGGQASPVRLLVAFVVVWAACFCRPGAIVGYTLLSSLTFAAPYFYGEAVSLAPFVREQVVIVFGLGAIALTIALLRRALDRARQRHAASAEEQRALLRVATAVADGVPAEELHHLVATQVGLLFRGQAGAIVRVEGSEGIVMGAWSDGMPQHPPGMRFPVSTTGPAAQTLRDHVPTRASTSAGDLPDAVGRLGYHETVIAPVLLDHHVWGVISVSAAQEGQLGAEVGARLMDFGALIATAVANAEAREQLADQAFSDPLTGLANHRVFHERLAASLERAQRTGGALSLVLLDVDTFKAVNDGAGHEAGDRVLIDLAARLREVARGGDLLARIGGDEFGWLLPDTSADEALRAVERARASVAASPLGGRTGVTISAGICDLAEAGDADALFRLADGALYWSKAHGRDRARVYDPETVRELSAQERAERLAHQQALLGIRALARAIDAKDTTTLEHSTRVAALACALARVRGWSEERVGTMEEAALVHDVGKIGIPDAVLLKPSRLTREEYEIVKRHAALGAQIVEDVLTPEQVAWIRGHHERPDGRGYPDGLVGAELSEGAALLALADAYDVMTAERPYSPPKDPAVALAECRALIGEQFTADAVAALDVVLAERAAEARADAAATLAA